MTEAPVGQIAEVSEPGGLGDPEPQSRTVSLRFLDGVPSESRVG
jgi:hypothetical protein